MNYEHIIFSVKEHIAIITLSRVDALNAFTNRMGQEIVDAFDHVDSDDDIRAVIVTGQGRAFCAGADLTGGASGFLVSAQEDQPRRPDGRFEYTRETARDGGGLVTLRIYACLKPVIAAINGPAVGIGATITLPMDIRISSDMARFGFVFARRGIVPEAASSFFLPRIVGISKALEWCYSGNVFPAAEALAAGLVSAIHPPGDLLPAAMAIAHAMTDNSAPVSIALTRQMMWRGLGFAHPMEAHRIDSRAILSRSHSTDASEGVAAFLEKRDAHFPGRVSADMPDFFPWWTEQSYS